MIRYCDWCGAYCDCDKCDDPATAALMAGLDDPMDESVGGHVHACCDEHELYWKDAEYWTAHEGHDPEEGGGVLSVPGCECHARRETLLRDVRAGWREDATEEDKQLAVEILAKKVVWCAMCDEWVLPKELRPNTRDQGPPMCIDCMADNNIPDPEMEEENR